MTFNVDIECDNDAFYPNPALEIGRILRRIAEELESAIGDMHGFQARYRDINGNAVAKAEVSK